MQIHLTWDLGLILWINKADQFKLDFLQVHEPFSMLFMDKTDKDEIQWWETKK